MIGSTFEALTNQIAGDQKIQKTKSKKQKTKNKMKITSG
uniref:Uncharacterized protein n=1 Tax=Rhizophora mucronata TaxID=61149 RepID=A0A2P2ML48_RHIMU